MIEEMMKWREAIDELDDRILLLLNYRFQYCKRIGEIKKENGIVTKDAIREKDIIERLSSLEKYEGMAETIWPVIMDFSKELQKK